MCTKKRFKLTTYFSQQEHKERWSVHISVLSSCSCLFSISSEYSTGVEWSGVNAGANKIRKDKNNRKKHEKYISTFYVVSGET